MRRHLPFALLLACGPGEAPVDGGVADSQATGALTYTAETAVMESFPVRLVTTATVRNDGVDAVEVTYPDGCTVLLRVHADSSRQGEPVWNQGRATACTLALVVVTIPPGGERELRTSVDARTILGDSLPDGRYWLSALLRPDGDSVEVPAGDAELAVPRDGVDGAAAPDGTSAAGAIGHGTPLTPTGWGPLRIGMTRDEVVAAAGEDANPDAVGGPEPEMCDEFRPREAPPGLLVMIRRDTLSRISLGSGSDVRTDRGVGVGSSGAEVRAAYGAAALVEPHAYQSSPAAYLTVWNARPRVPSDSVGIRYEVGSDGTIQRIHAGDESIRYVEGCV